MAEPTPPAFPALETPRLLLREVVEADVPDLFAIHSAPRLMAWYGADALVDVEGAHKMVALFKSWRALPNPGVRWALQARDGGPLLGTCGLFNWNRAWRRCTLGYELATQAQGQGLMREALGAALNWGFEQMDLHRVEALIHPLNKPSQRVVQSLGFVCEGVLREVARFKGEQHDMQQWSLLRRDHFKGR